jgi:hypothetical protein
MHVYILWAVMGLIFETVWFSMIFRSTMIYHINTLENGDDIDEKVYLIGDTILWLRWSIAEQPPLVTLVIDCGHKYMTQVTLSNMDFFVKNSSKVLMFFMTKK